MTKQGRTITYGIALGIIAILATQGGWMVVCFLGGLSFGYAIGVRDE